jgi:hypothetical protein
MMFVSGKLNDWKTIPFAQLMVGIAPPAVLLLNAIWVIQSSKLYSITSCMISFFQGSIVISNIFSQLHAII